MRGWRHSPSPLSLSLTHAYTHTIYIRKLRSYCFCFDEITCKPLFFKKEQRGINTFEYKICV